MPQRIREYEKRKEKKTTGETNARSRLKQMEIPRDTIKEKEKEKEKEREAMETSDVEMMNSTEAAAGTSRKMENAWCLLSRARQLIAEGNPTLALQTVLSAIRSEGGENAVLRAMSRARELYRQRAQSEADMGDLTALLAQCAIEEASGSSPTAVSNPFCGPGRDPSELLTAPDAILAESGRRQVILDAFADGSSFICLNCGGLISSSRKDEHLQNWCK